jgi:hypothetical protein
VVLINEGYPWGVPTYFRYFRWNRRKASRIYKIILVGNTSVYWELRSGNSMPSNNRDVCARASAFFVLLVPVLLAFASLSFLRRSFISIAAISRACYDSYFRVCFLPYRTGATRPYYCSLATAFAICLLISFWHLAVSILCWVICSRCRSLETCWFFRICLFIYTSCPPLR